MFEPDDLLVALTAANVELVKEALTVRFRDTEINVCGIEHLRAMKRTAGREQDLTDLRELSSAEC